MVMNNCLNFNITYNLTQAEESWKNGSTYGIGIVKDQDTQKSGMQFEVEKNKDFIYPIYVQF